MRILFELNFPENEEYFFTKIGVLPFFNALYRLALEIFKNY
jgi:hypothetical protein